MAHSLRARAVVAGAFVVALYGCTRRPDPTPPAPVEAPDPLPADIEQQVHAFCGAACHAYPPADSFPRAHWRAEVERGFSFFDKSGMAFKPPKVGHVVRYYQDRAPDEYPPLKVTPASKPLATRFEQLSYPPPEGARPMISHVSAVKLPTGMSNQAARDRDPVTVLACDMVGGRILALRPTDAKPAWKVLARVPNPAHAEVVDLDGDGILDIVVANLGSYPPTDERCGSVVWLRGLPDGTFQSVTLLKNVGRVADVRAADFCGTGKLDLVVGVFGLHAVGETILLENRTTDWSKPDFRPTVLDARHGPIHVPVADLNGDGKPDFVALIAQEHEMVVAFINEGKGGVKFAKKTLYRAPHPGWGSSGIQLIDMNGDGKLDVLYTNGDILDEPYLLKPYHGVQWLENKGDLRFEHQRIADMYGVHNAFAARVTGGPLPDVLAVSFLPHDKFPDRAARNADAVVLFEQVSPGKFERHTLATASCDAVVCHAADLYGTGRVDLLVGNFASPTTDHPVAIWKNVGKK